jgi:hypothetical protein
MSLSKPWWYRGGVGVQLHSFLTSAPGGDQLSVSRLGQIAPGERNVLGGQVGPISGLDVFREEKNPLLFASALMTESNEVSGLLVFI